MHSHFGSPQERPFAMDKPSPVADPFGALEFEVTDFAEARAALDALPAGVLAVQRAQPGYWERQRRDPVPADKALTGAAIEWMLSLPRQVRPNVAADRYPRVVNAIAAAWIVPANRRAVVEHYLTDSRGMRRGFPLAVQAELEALRHFVAD